MQPEVWRDFGNNNQASAAFRPWMPCPGNHEVEFDNGPQGYTSYLTRYLLPDNGIPAFRGRWYAFRVGSALFVSLDASDVIYQDAGAFVAGPTPLNPGGRHGQPADRAGHVVLHPRLFPWRADGLAAPDAGRGPPRRLDRLDYRPAPTATAGVYARPGADAVEDATWSAKRDPATGYGVAVFDVDPGERGGHTSITVTYYHAVGADPVNAHRAQQHGSSAVLR